MTQLLHGGANTLDVQVRMASAGEPRGAFGAGRAGGRRGSPPRAGTAANAGGPPSGLDRAAPTAPVTASGLLGPVGVLAQ